MPTHQTCAPKEIYLLHAMSWRSDAFDVEQDKDFEEVVTAC